MECNVVARVIAMSHQLKGKEREHLDAYFEQLALMTGSLQDRRRSQFVFEPSAARRAELRARAAFLLTLPQAPQCSPEWFAYRRGAPGPDGVYVGGRITASDTGTILGMNEYACPEEVVVKKAGVPTFNWSPACEHGKKYEDVTVAVFQSREGKVVREYGCIDGTDGRVAASPDGITEDGEAVEIKNPSSRKPTGIPKPSYFAQIQQQLAVLDLEKCHFVETVIREYASRDAYMADHAPGRPDAAWTAAGNEKGVLIEIVDDAAGGGAPPSFRYVYAPFGLPTGEVSAWVNSELERIGDDLPETRTVLVRYWRVDLYLNTPVYRDRAWWAAQQPAIRRAWAAIEEARRNPEALAKAKAVYAAFTEEKEERFGRGKRGGHRSRVRKISLPTKKAGSHRRAAGSPPPPTTPDASAFDGLFGSEREFDG